MITLTKALDLSIQEINEQLKDLSIVLKRCTTRDAEWGDLIDDYLILKSVLHSRCQEQKIHEFEKYYDLLREAGIDVDGEDGLKI